MELYKKHRPKTFDAVVGNKETVTALKNMIHENTLPQTILFHGPSGVGKTTLARILKSELNCGDMDFRELNCSDVRGIDTIRSIIQSVSRSPIDGDCRIWLLDEFHQASKDAQNAALKLLEDTPKNVYFFICTTDPKKIIKTIRTRCTEMPLVSLSDSDMKGLLRKVSKLEKIALDSDTADSIVDCSNGSARSALVLLDKIKNIPKNQWEKSIQGIDSEESEAIRKLCQALFKKESWSKITKLLKDIPNDPETVRYAVLGYASAILLNKNDPHAYKMIVAFEDNFYDSKKSGLIRACYDVIFNEI